MNEVALTAPYEYEYRDGILCDILPPLRILTETRARMNFISGRQDALHLLYLHDEKTKKQRGRPSERLESLKRAAIILTVTAWETFVEDTLVDCLKTKLGAAKAPADVLSTFNHVAHHWLTSEKNKLTCVNLARWTGDQWKERVLECFNDEIASFNTPNSKKTNHLFDKYLGIQIHQKWVWPSISSDRACAMLDKLIMNRGALVHRSKPSFMYPTSDKSVSRASVVQAVNLTFRLMTATELALGVGATVAAE